MERVRCCDACGLPLSEWLESEGCPFSEWHYEDPTPVHQWEVTTPDDVYMTDETIDQYEVDLLMRQPTMHDLLMPDDVSDAEAYDI